MISRKYPTTTKTARMEKRRNNKRNKREQRGIRNTKPLTTHRKGKQIPEEEQKENTRRILKGINFKWGEMSCPAEAYQLIMGKKKRNSAAIKIKETTKNAAEKKKKRKGQKHQ